MTKQIQFILIVLFSLNIVEKNAFAGKAEPQPRALLLYTAQTSPNASEVLALLRKQSAVAGMEIEIAGEKVEAFPQSDEHWFALAKKSAADARTITVFAYSCIGEACTVTAIQQRDKAKLSLAYPCPEANDKAAFATAAAIREMLLGPLLGELRRLAREARAPSAPEKAGDVLLRSPFDGDRGKKPEELPRLRLEGAYQGDGSYPSGRSAHGVSFGVDFEPAPMFGIAVHTGWLGMGKFKYESAEIGLQRLNAALTFRFIFPIGPARIAVGATGRLDLVFLSVDNPLNFKDGKDRYWETSVGGIAAWRLPLPKGLSLVIGVGVTACVYSQEVDAMDLAGNLETAVPSSILRMIWTVGLAFSPFGTPSGR